MIRNFRFFTLVVLLVGFFNVHSADALNCNVAVRCSFEPPVAWATDGANCKVFYNPCHLFNHNCDRQRRGETILTDTTQQECFQNCRPGCTRESNPVCTINKGVSTTYENPCLWALEMCTNQEAYIFQFHGRCGA